MDGRGGGGGGGVCVRISVIGSAVSDQFPEGQHEAAAVWTETLRDGDWRKRHVCSRVPLRLDLEALQTVEWPLLLENLPKGHAKRVDLPGIRLFLEADLHIGHTACMQLATSERC